MMSPTVDATNAYFVGDCDCESDWRETGALGRAACAFGVCRRLVGPRHARRRNRNCGARDARTHRHRRWPGAARLSALAQPSLSAGANLARATGGGQRRVDDAAELAR